MKKDIKKEENLSVEERIRRINGTMAIEGMSLTDKDVEVLINCILGKSTHEVERQKIIERCKQENGRRKSI